MADNSLTWPNAEILLPAKEHAYWMDDGEMSLADNFKNVRRVFNPDVLAPTSGAGKWCRGSPRKARRVTRSGTHRMSLAPGSDAVYVQSDVTHVPFLFVLHPDWHAFYDQDGVMAQDTRHKVYDILAAEKMRVQGFYYPFPSLAHVDKNGTGYRYIPVPWNPTI
jgi:hypothetical protein